MWFAHKGEAYRLGYAESDDGIRWQRDDSFAGVAPSASGWDSQMVEYAAVARHGARYFMFYNGDNYGAGGIGLEIGRASCRARVCQDVSNSVVRVAIKKKNYN